MTDEILTPPAANTLPFQPSAGGVKPPDSDGYDTAIQDSLRREDIKVVVEDGPDMKIRLAEITAAVNPLLAAASPLLCALAQMPRELSLVLSNIIVPYWSVKFVDIRRYAIRQTFAANMCWLCVIAYALRWTKPPTTPPGGGAVSGLEKACWSLFMEKVKAASSCFR